MTKTVNAQASPRGISLHTIVERKDLEKFATDLEIEYDNLKKI